MRFARATLRSARRCLCLAFLLARRAAALVFRAFLAAILAFARASLALATAFFARSAALPAQTARLSARLFAALARRRDDTVPSFFAFAAAALARRRAAFARCAAAFARCAAVFAETPILDARVANLLASEVFRLAVLVMTSARFLAFFARATEFFAVATASARSSVLRCCRRAFASDFVSAVVASTGGRSSLSSAATTVGQIMFGTQWPGPPGEVVDPEIEGVAARDIAAASTPAISRFELMIMR
ncbi:MAG: hypothetical protein ACE5FS_10510 [Paracoccaceae bacterium]